MELAAGIMQYALLQPSNALEECPDYYRLIQDLMIIEEIVFMKECEP